LRLRASNARNDGERDNKQPPHFTPREIQTVIAP